MSRTRKFVHSFTDRHGKRRHYFRRPGFAQIPLPGLFGSDEFERAYEMALAGVTVPPPGVGVNRTKPGTVNAAVVGYYQSFAFCELAPATQSERRNILEHFRGDPYNFGNNQIATLTSQFIVKLLNHRTAHSAHNWLKTLRALLDFCVKEGFRPDNPASGIKFKLPKSDGFHAWNEAEIAAFEAYHLIGTHARLALALLLHTGQRRGDVIRMGPQHVRDGAIHVRQGKTGATLVIPIHPSLQMVLDATPCKNLTFLTGRGGRPFNGNDFTMRMRRWCDEAGLPECSPHGLRKAAARRLAEAGASVHQIAAITGHRSLKEVARYTQGADQVRLAREAIQLISAKNKTSDTGGKLS
jgi:integrase